MERERVIEVLLAMILLVLVFLMMLIGLTLGDSSKHTSKVIANSYNTVDNSKTVYYEDKEVVRPIVYYKEVPRSKYSEDHEWEDWSYYWKDYDSEGKHTKTYEMGAYVDTFKVYVYNKGDGDYFTVRFYFEDYEGHKRSYDVRRYLEHNEEKMFYYRDISKDKYEYYRWSYKVLT